MRIGPYELDAELGRGGMGAVYRGRDAHGRVVAVKVVTAIGDVEAALRFQREVAAVGRLEHPGVVPVLDAGVEGGRPWLVMPLVDGPSLAARLRTGGPLPWREAAGVVARVARAVAHAHARGVLHRDLKASNVLLGVDGPVLVDFGLARSLAPEGSLAGLTRTGQVAGTPGFMAPEQARGDAGAIGPATDVYGLGALLFEALTGRAPFVGASALEVLEAVLAAPAEAPSRAAPAGAGLPAALDALCIACLAKDPAARPASAEAVAVSLERVAGGREDGRAAGAGAGARPARAARVARAAALAAAVALAGAAGAAAVRARRGATPIGEGPPSPAGPDAGGAPGADAAKDAGTEAGGGPAAGVSGGAAVAPGTDAPAPADPDAPGAAHGGPEPDDEALLEPIAEAIGRADVAAARRLVDAGLARWPEQPALLAAAGSLALVVAEVAADPQARAAGRAEGGRLLDRALALGADRPAVRLVRARAALRAGDLAKCERELAAARALAPAAPAVRALGVQVDLAVGRLLTGWLELDALLRWEPDGPAPAAIRCELLAQRGEHAAVLAAITRAGPVLEENLALGRYRLRALAALDPIAARAVLAGGAATGAPVGAVDPGLAALCLARAGEAERALARCPDEPEVAAEVAGALLALGHVLEGGALALRALRAAGPGPAAREARGPRATIARARLEALYARTTAQQSTAEAIAALERALAIAPDDPVVELAAGYFALKAPGRAPPFDAARLRARLADGRGGPDAAAAWGLLGGLAARAQRLEEAEDALARALALLEPEPGGRPARASIAAWRAQLRLARDDVEGALRDLETAVEGLPAGAPQRAPLEAERARLLALAGDLAGARAVLAALGAPAADAPEERAIRLARATLALAEGAPAAALRALGDAPVEPGFVAAGLLRARARAETEPARLEASLSARPPATWPAHIVATIGRARLVRGDAAGATEVVAPLLAAPAPDAYALATCAAVAGARGDAEAARALLRRLEGRVPAGHLEVRWALARLDAQRAADPALTPAARALEDARDALAAGDAAEVARAASRVPAGTPGRTALLARVALDAGDPGGAERHVRDASAEDPSDPDPWLVRAIGANAVGRPWAEVRAVLDEALARAARNPVGARVVAARLARAHGATRTALEHVRAALAVDPGDPRARAQALDALDALDTLDDASPAERRELRDLAEDFVATHPRSAAPLRVRARLRLAAGDPLGALVDARGALERVPRLPQAVRLAALAWWRLGRPDLAAPLVEDAARTDGLGAAAALALRWLPVWLALARGGDEDGLARAEALVRRGDPRGLLARALDLAGRHDAALAEARAAAGEARGGDPDAAVVLARAALASGDAAGAAATCEAALARAPDHPGLLLARGLARWRARAAPGLGGPLEGEAEGARADLERAARSTEDPAWWEARFALDLLAEEERAPRGPR